MKKPEQATSQQQSNNQKFKSRWPDVIGLEIVGYFTQDNMDV